MPIKFTKTQQTYKNIVNLINIIHENLQTDLQMTIYFTLQWRHNERDGVSNRQPIDCLLNRLFRHRSKKTSKLRVIGLCAADSTVTYEFPAQRISNAENVSICIETNCILPEYPLIISASTPISLQGNVWNKVDSVSELVPDYRIFGLDLNL